MMNKLALKSLLGFLNLLFFMCVMLFLPAKTFEYLQAWIYIIIFFASILIITIYIFIKDKQLLKSRLKVGSVSEKRISQKIIQGFASAGFIGMYVISGFDYHYKWSHIPNFLWISADVMLTIAMLFMFLVFKFNTYLSATIEVQNNQRVITNGPYRFVRHPMYSAAILLFFSTPIALGSFWALIVFPLMLTVLIFRCIDEEKLLINQLNGYKDYCLKTKYRLIPFVW